MDDHISIFQHQITPCQKQGKIIVIDEEEEVTFHGTINPEEAKIHTIELEKSMDIIEESKLATLQDYWKQQ